MNEKHTAQTVWLQNTWPGGFYESFQNAFWITLLQIWFHHRTVSNSVYLNHLLNCKLYFFQRGLITIKQVMFVNIITECTYDNEWPGLRLKAGELNQTTTVASFWYVQTSHYYGSRCRCAGKYLKLHKHDINVTHVSLDQRGLLAL